MMRLLLSAVGFFGLTAATLAAGTVLFGYVFQCGGSGCSHAAYIPFSIGTVKADAALAMLDAASAPQPALFWKPPF